MVTNSGVRVEPDNYQHGLYANTPSIRDCAVGMYRICRYGGHTTQWWSVLNHTLAGFFYLRRLLVRDGVDQARHSAILLDWLLHDAHEAVTSDIPSHWKSDDMKELQDSIDERIRILYDLPPELEDEDYVTKVDSQMLQAEAALFGPPGILAYLDTSELEDLAVQAVTETMELVDKDDPRVLDGAVAIKVFLKAFNSLVGKVNYVPVGE